METNTRKLEWRHVITREDVDNGKVTAEGYKTFVSEASQLRLRPGQVPRVIPTTLGNGQPFVLVSADSQVFKYMQDLGCIELHVLND